MAQGLIGPKDLAQALGRTPQLCEPCANVWRRTRSTSIYHSGSRPSSGLPDDSGRTCPEWRCAWAARVKTQCITNHQPHVRWSWAVGAIWECLIQNNMKEARARCALLIAAADQTAIDSGSWLLSGVALLEPPPPFHAFAAHQSPAPQELQRPLFELCEGDRHLPGDHFPFRASCRPRSKAQSKAEGQEQRERKRSWECRHRGRSLGPSLNMKFFSSQLVLLLTKLRSPIFHHEFLALLLGAT